MRPMTEKQARSWRPLTLFDAREIKRRADFVAIVSRYTKLRRAGSQYRGLCLFHSERNPSLYIEPQQKLWKCFGCGAGGDVFAFVMLAEQCDFPSALRIVAGFSGKSSGGAPRRLETLTEAAERIVSSLPAPGFVPACQRCLKPMAFCFYRGNRFGGVYRCEPCLTFFGPRELREGLFLVRGGVCEWCGGRVRIEMHHLRKHGPQFEPSSIVLLCSGCHHNVRKILSLFLTFERRSRECPERSEGRSPHSRERGAASERVVCEPRSGESLLETTE